MLCVRVPVASSRAARMRTMSQLQSWHAHQPPVRLVAVGAIVAEVAGKVAAGVAAGVAAKVTLVTNL